MTAWILGRNKTNQNSLFDGVPSGATKDDNGKVIVIGVGAAGLSAARALQDQGCEVVILEGRERIGGRLHTIQVGGGIMDEGGNWIHGAPKNPLFHLVQEADLRVKKDSFIYGDQVRLMAKDAEPFIERATEILKEIFPDDYQDPTAVHVTNWGQDPFSRGSYSTAQIGVTAKDYERLGQPVAGRVLFAGEATYREHAGYVEGAMGSGLREARRILGHEVDLHLMQAEARSAI